MDLDPALESFVRSVLPDADWVLEPLVDSRGLVIRAHGGAGDLVARIQPTSRIYAPTANALVAYLIALAADPALRVPSPRRLADGEWFAFVDRNGAEHRCSLVTWVPGARAPDARAFVEPARLRAVAAMVARMHEIALHVSPDIARPVPRVDADALLGPTGCLGHASLREELGGLLHQRLSRACETMAAVLRSRDRDPDQVGLIHADLAPQNWVFRDGQPGVIDFDEFRRGPFALDLLGVLWSHAMWDDYPRLCEILLEGYESVRPLPAGTREDADVLMAIACFTWIDFIHRELTEDGRTCHRPHLRPLAEHITRWCSAD